MSIAETRLSRRMATAGPENVLAGCSGFEVIFLI
jgi:hypothetical protein